MQSVIKDHVSFFYNREVHTLRNLFCVHAMHFQKAFNNNT